MGLGMRTTICVGNIDRGETARVAGALREIWGSERWDNGVG